MTCSSEFQTPTPKRRDGYHLRIFRSEKHKISDHTHDIEEKGLKEKLNDLESKNPLFSKEINFGHSYSADNLTVKNFKLMLCLAI